MAAPVTQTKTVHLRAGDEADLAFDMHDVQKRSRPP